MTLSVVAELVEGYHGLLHFMASSFGHQADAAVPEWLDAVLHVVLIWGPVAFAALIVVRVTTWLYRRRPVPHRRRPADGAADVRGLPAGVFTFILRFSRAGQLRLMALGLLTMPVLYLSLELPKLIINSAINSGHFPVAYFALSLSQNQFLFTLSSAYLATVIGMGILKYTLNVHKGAVGERLLRRLRVTVYRRWREGAGGERRSEVVPLIAQEVEPVGGFAGEAFAVPVFEAGTLLTILIFMFAQDPILGAAAITLLPVQIAIIPRLQRRVNRLARWRVAEMRSLCGEIGDQAAAASRHRGQIHAVAATLKRVEKIRRELHRAKFFIKSLNNFLASLTPFFFYSIGGYLVIEGRLSLGALIAVLAAYKDLSVPVRELFRYYQTAEDVRVRYTELSRFLASSGGTRASSATQQPTGHLARDRELTRAQLA